MFDIIHRLEKGAWIFENIEKRDNYYKIFFTAMIHTKKSFNIYNDIFSTLEKENFSTKKECLDYCNQIFYQIEKGII
ncbi:MAG: hypothetical protein WC516_09665 [Patescibacteria group bacterium]|jgi:hypothetical protein